MVLICGIIPFGHVLYGRPGSTGLASGLQATGLVLFHSGYPYVSLENAHLQEHEFEDALAVEKSTVLHPQRLEVTQ